MFDTIRNAWKIVDLRKKLIYTFIMLIIFRLGSTIPVPLINPEMLEQMFTGDNTMFGFIDIVSGGAFKNATIFAMSITPYINSSIIMQLLCVAIPALERLQKEGEERQKKDWSVYEIRYGCTRYHTGCRSLLPAEKLKCYNQPRLAVGNCYNHNIYRGYCFPYVAR